MLTRINNLLKLVNCRLIGNGSYHKLLAERAEKDAFAFQQRLYPNPEIIFDVGANRGQSIAIYRKMYPAAVLHCFEPQPQLADQLCGLDDPHVYVNQQALSDRQGSTAFFLKQSDGAASTLKSVEIGASSDRSVRDTEKIEVQTETLDAYCGKHNIEKIDILKMDVQGGEYALLQGAQQMLKEKRIGLIYAESYFKQQYADQPLFPQLVELLNTHDYFVQDIYNCYYSEKHLLWCDFVALP